MTISEDDGGNGVLGSFGDGIAKDCAASGRGGRASMTGGNGRPGQTWPDFGLDEPSPKVLGIRSTSIGNGMKGGWCGDAGLACGVGDDGLEQGVFVLGATPAALRREVDGEVGRTLPTSGDV